MDVPFSLVATTGCVTVVLASALAYALLDRRRRRCHATKSLEDDETASPSNKQEVDMSLYPGGSFSVYFATQTGTAESFARELEREGADRGFLLHVMDLEDIASLQELDQRSVFLCATYGEGEAPDNANTFCQWLSEQAHVDLLLQNKEEQEVEHSTSLSHVQYAVFGLGNKQYDHYNAMGKFFHTALERLGAQPLLPLGMGDDDDDLEADFELWKETHFWPTVLKKYHPGTNGAAAKPAPAQHRLPDCPIQVVYHDDNKATPPKYDLPPEAIHSSSRHYFTAVQCPVTVVRELQQSVSNNNESTVHVEIDIAQAQPLESATTNGKKHSQRLLDYTTADNLGVLPVNHVQIVERVAKSLQYDLQQIISVQAAPDKEWHGAPFPNPCTVRDCLSYYCDLTGAPRRSDLKLLANYCPPNSVDQQALLRLSSKEGRQEYKEKILQQQLGLVDLLQLCPSIQMPLEHFLNVCPPLQTRFFTISSSSSVHPDTIHLTVAVTNHKRQDGSLFEGVCSNYLAKSGGSANKPMMIRVFHRPSTFRLPKDPSRPILMIGPGTGVAPMRALLQERQFQKQQGNQSVGQNILYFGCKKAKQDYIYQDELEAFVKNGILDHLRVAFSRDQSEKMYVQHLLQQHAEETWNLLDQQNVYIYVCGGVKMGHDVAETLKQIMSSQGNMSTEDAAEYMARLSKEGRYIQELWA